MRATGISSLILLAAGAVQAASSSWGFDDGSVSVSSKKAAGDATKEKFGPKSPLETPITLNAQDTLTVSLTAKDSGKAKRPHQAFLLLKDESGLEAPFPLSVKDSGKAKVQITQKDIPVQFLASSKPVHATVVIGSFGSAQGAVADVFDLDIKQDSNAPAPVVPSTLRYGKKPRIHHVFREETKYPYKIFSIFFVLVIAATLPALLVGWFGFLGANLSSLPKALGAAPLSHATFFGSVLAIEFVYFLYHRGLSLGHILLPVAVLGTTTVFSGMKALGEVQSRRLAGQR